MSASLGSCLWPWLAPQVREIQRLHQRGEIDLLARDHQVLRPLRRRTRSAAGRPGAPSRSARGRTAAASSSPSCAGAAALSSSSAPSGPVEITASSSSPAAAAASRCCSGRIRIRRRRAELVVGDDDLFLQLDLEIERADRVRRGSASSARSLSQVTSSAQLVEHRARRSPSTSGRASRRPLARSPPQSVIVIFLPSSKIFGVNFCGCGRWRNASAGTLLPRAEHARPHEPAPAARRADRRASASGTRTRPSRRAARASARRAPRRSAT